MKITVEIPNFEIWGNNDETPIDFIAELKERVMDKLADDIAKEIRNRKVLTEIKYHDLFENFEKRLNEQIEETATKFERDTNAYITKLKNKSSLL